MILSIQLPCGYELELEVELDYTGEIIGKMIERRLLFGSFTTRPMDDAYTFYFIKSGDYVIRKSRERRFLFDKAVFEDTVRAVFGIKQRDQISHVTIGVRTEVENVYISTTSHIAPVPIKEYAFIGGNKGDVLECMKLMFFDDTPPVKVTSMYKNEEGVLFADSSAYSEDESTIVYVILQSDGLPFEDVYLTTWTNSNGKQHMAYLETPRGGTTLAEMYPLDKGFVWIGNTVVDRRRCFIKCKVSETGGLMPI